jgi:hypothetical protein
MTSTKLKNTKVDATDEEWQEFIDRITKRTSKNRRDGP